MTSSAIGLPLQWDMILDLYQTAAKARLESELQCSIVECFYHPFQSKP